MSDALNGYHGFNAKTGMVKVDYIRNILAMCEKAGDTEVPYGVFLLDISSPADFAAMSPEAKERLEARAIEVMNEQLPKPPTWRPSGSHAVDNSYESQSILLDEDVDIRIFRQNGGAWIMATSPLLPKTHLHIADELRAKASAMNFVHERAKRISQRAYLAKRVAEDPTCFDKRY